MSPQGETHVDMELENPPKRFVKPRCAEDLSLHHCTSRVDAIPCFNLLVEIFICWSSTDTLFSEIASLFFLDEVTATSLLLRTMNTKVSWLSCIASGEKLLFLLRLVTVPPWFHYHQQLGRSWRKCLRTARLHF
jgi:hypothetical protein